MQPCKGNKSIPNGMKKEVKNQKICHPTYNNVKRGKKNNRTVQKQQIEKAKIYGNKPIHQKSDI